MLSRLLVALVLLLPLAACASSTTTTPRSRVAADLGCTPDRTIVQRLDGNRWQVSGCGRTAIYLCTYPVRDCWREGAIHSQ
jgi:hypothetical protein